MTDLQHNSPIVLKETFAPIVYVIKCSSIDEAIQINNEAKQGLSSSLFTKSIPDLFKVILSLYMVKDKLVVLVLRPLRLLAMGKTFTCK